MKFFPVIVLSIVQGLAEFLPVSSSGHLALLGHFLGTRSPGGGMVLEIVLHVGTLFAVLVFYRSYLAGLASGVFRGERESIRTLLLIVLASIPAGFLGLLLKDRIETVFASPWLVSGLLAVNGLILLLAGRRGTDSPRSPGFLSAVIGGLAQAVAILPGISRSGSTISAIAATRVSQKDAARFSFLMSIPAVAGAGLLEMRDISAVPPSDLLPLALGLVISFVTGCFALKLLIGLLGRNRLWVFGVYCLAASCASFAFLLNGV